MGAATRHTYGTLGRPLTELMKSVNESHSVDMGA